MNVAYLDRTEHRHRPAEICEVSMPPGLFRTWEGHDDAGSCRNQAL